MNELRLPSYGRMLRKYFLLCALLTLIVVVLYYMLTPLKSNNKHKSAYKYFKNEETTFRKPTPFEGERIIHLDLKGAPPKISYYKTLFPLLSKMGATGLLIEYEDMFPYSGELLKNVSALNAYSLDDIFVINNLAKQSNLKVIPLVQTFGHLEFLLKLKQFKEYREVYSYPQVICPRHENTLDLLMDMIGQVIEAHPQSELIHIGADEVYYLGMCNRCLNAMSKYNLSKTCLFLEHVTTVATKIKENYPHIKVLMWDDEFRGISELELKKSRITTKVEPVVWKYSKDVYEDLGPSLWQMYSESFPNVWIASAFKGATGSNQYVSEVTYYLENHRSWLSLVSEYKNRINFKGIIITGWQRYDHFAVLCELLPVGLPSLAMSLRLVLGYEDSPLSPPMEVAKLLQCEQPYALIGSAFGSPKCSYPGGEILENVLHLQQLKQEYDTIMEDSRSRGWFSDYNINHTFSSPQYIESVTAPLSKIKIDLTYIDSRITDAMQEVYDNYTIEEWKETYIKPFAKKVSELWEARETLLSKEEWPRRPLEFKESKDDL